eukprot:5854590-Amphidinium_carterae.1
MVMAWAGLRGDPPDTSSESASRLVHLNMAAAEHPRYVAALMREQYGDYLVGWRPLGADPTPRQLGAANLVHRGCVAACAPPVPQVAVATTVAPAAPPPPRSQEDGAW